MLGRNKNIKYNSQYTFIIIYYLLPTKYFNSKFRYLKVKKINRVQYTTPHHHSDIIFVWVHIDNNGNIKNKNRLKLKKAGKRVRVDFEKKIIPLGCKNIYCNTYNFSEVAMVRSALTYAIPEQYVNENVT